MIYPKDYPNQKRNDYTGNIFVKTGKNFINNLTPKKDKITNKHSRNNIEQKNLNRSKSSDTEKYLFLRKSLEVNYDDNEKNELYNPISKINSKKYLNTSRDFSKKSMKESMNSNITNNVLFPDEINMNNNRYDNEESNNLRKEKKIPNEYSYKEFEKKDYNTIMNSQLLKELKDIDTYKEIKNINSKESINSNNSKNTVNILFDEESKNEKGESKQKNYFLKDFSKRKDYSVGKKDKNNYNYYFHLSDSNFKKLENIDTKEEIKQNNNNNNIINDENKSNELFIQNKKDEYNYRNKYNEENKKQMDRIDNYINGYNLDDNTDYNNMPEKKNQYNQNILNENNVEKMASNILDEYRTNQNNSKIINNFRYDKDIQIDNKQANFKGNNNGRPIVNQDKKQFQYKINIFNNNHPNNNPINFFNINNEIYKSFTRDSPMNQFNQQMFGMNNNFNMNISNKNVVISPDFIRKVNINIIPQNNEDYY